MIERRNQTRLTNKSSYAVRQRVEDDRRRGEAATKPARGTPKPGKAKPMEFRNGLTMRMMMKATHTVGVTLKGAAGVRLSNLSKKQTTTQRYGKIPHLQFTAVDPSSVRQPAKKHKVDILLRDGAKLAPGTPMSAAGSNLLVSCSCENFMYMCEYALTKYNASWIRYCNGEPPRITNPGLVPLVCKHIYRAFQHMSKQGL